MRIGMPMSFGGGFADTAADIAEFEAAGLDMIFVPEAYSFISVNQLGFLAAETSRLQSADQSLGSLQIYADVLMLTTEDRNVGRHPITAVGWLPSPLWPRLRSA